LANRAPIAFNYQVAGLSTSVLAEATVRVSAIAELCLKQHHRRSIETQFIDPDFAEALNEGESNGRSRDRQSQRKALQFCRQVQRALNLALESLNSGDDAGGLFVEEVWPAPDCSHLLVHIAIPHGRNVAAALGALRRDAARLRAEVAMAITRKRAPELSFIPAWQEAGEDE
jgi:ribosome-binding factor A